jgi:HEAT repeat protein
MSEINHSTPVSAATDSELKEAILLLQEPFGGGAHEREHLRTVQYLLDNAARAHPYLVELLHSGKAANPYAVIELLPKFGLPESMPVLEGIMERGPENLAQAAAQALAAHPLTEALEALLRGLKLSKEESVIAAVKGLMLRGDTSACAKLEKLLTTQSASLRYHAIQAAGALGCLKRDALLAISRNDVDEDIRELANGLIDEAPAEETR